MPKGSPQDVQKFKKFGLQKFNKNKNGCTENCEFYHPRACFEAMKTKMCKRNDCKFFHITGTKKKITQAQQIKITSTTATIATTATTTATTATTATTTATTEMLMVTSGIPIQTSILNIANNQPRPRFFRKQDSPGIAIEKMAAQMERMMSLQESFQTSRVH